MLVNSASSVCSHQLGFFPFQSESPPKKFENYYVIIASTANRVLNMSRILKYLAGIPMHILTCMCTFAHIYITTPQEKSRVKPWYVQSHSQAFPASTSFLCLLCSLPAHSQAFIVSSSFPGHFFAVQSGETKLSKAWDNILSPPFFSFSKMSHSVTFCTL